MVSAWFIPLCLVLGALAGAALILVMAAFIKTRPMDGRTYHYDAKFDRDTATAAVRQMFRDANKPGDDR